MTHEPASSSNLFISPFDLWMLEPHKCRVISTAAVRNFRTSIQAQMSKLNWTSVLQRWQSKHGTVQTSNENDLSLAALVSFGSFREEIGGDLSGANTQMYQDVETPVAPDVGKINVSKVHHHCSSHSTNDTWLADTQPAIGIISTGDGNDYGHPTADCLERLYTHNVKLYWNRNGQRRYTRIRIRHRRRQYRC
jgi:beta-lactamase superfamily II metal-dependent hydrolase